MMIISTTKLEQVLIFFKKKRQLIDKTNHRQTLEGFNTSTTPLDSVRGSPFLAVKINRIVDMTESSINSEGFVHIFNIFVW